MPPNQRKKKRRARAKALIVMLPKSGIIICQKIYLIFQWRELNQSPNQLNGSEMRTWKTVRLQRNF